MSNIDITEERFQLRDTKIPFPDTHTKVLLLGSTGVGKTTLLKKMLGVTNTKSSFLADSSSRTTLANTEIVTTDFESPFQAIVTFFKEDEIKDIIQTAIIAALDKVIEGSTIQKQAFAELYKGTKTELQLKHILGDVVKAYDKIDRNPQIKDSSAESILKKFKPLTKLLITCYDDYKRICETCVPEGYENLDTEGDKVAFEQLRNEELYKSSSFKTVYNHIKQRILQVITDAASGGTLESDKTSGWPVSWYMQNSKNRNDFISKLEFFTGNAVKLHGKLATPLVEGVRLSGPFNYNETTIPKFAIIDGKGVGHDNSNSVPIAVRSSFHFADKIAVITADAHDTRHATQLAISAVLKDGFDEKLSVVFSKLDAITGANIEDFYDQKTKAQESFELVLDGIKTELGTSSYDTLKDLSNNRSFYLSDINKEIMSNDAQSALTQYIESLQCDTFMRKVPAPPRIDGKESSNTTNKAYSHKLQVADKNNSPILALPKKTKKKEVNAVELNLDNFNKKKFTEELFKQFSLFNKRWLIILRLEVTGNIGNKSVKAEHWTRIRALTRYIGELGLAGYDTLDPSADIREVFADVIYKQTTSFTKKDRANLLQACSHYLNSSCGRVVNNDHNEQWLQAFNHLGQGSTSLRAKDIRAILENVISNRQQNQLLNGVLSIISKYC